MAAEKDRLKEITEKKALWYKWGPYLSERQWGTVREDYSQDGSSWDYFPHDHARSRAYLWGEDGIAGISDDKQRLCFALAMWNGKDPILKERLFGLTNREGNHGEDVKEYYYYLDNTPTHSYMKYLYKYPQAAYPYDDLVKINAGRSPKEPEYELVNTGVFKDNRYFDIQVEYAKASPNDILIRITAANRSTQDETIHLLPTLWFRNTWSGGTAGKPHLEQIRNLKKIRAVRACHSGLGDMFLVCQGNPAMLFTENETNTERLFKTPNASPYVKDAFDAYCVHRKRKAVNPAMTGTKAAAYYQLSAPAGQSVSIRLRLTDQKPSPSCLETEWDTIFSQRQREADEFYRSISPATASPDEAAVIRQAISGMLWSKQFYYFDANKWLTEHNLKPLQTGQIAVRNKEWRHMVNSDIICMPDKWEYPWYAAWDTAFHAVALSIADSHFAKQQLELMLHPNYMHPGGQIPAYEWNFSDVNPPVHAWATLFNYRLEKIFDGKGDIDFLRRCFRKLMLNFTWWVNHKDNMGNNLFEGGFLGLDNIGVFDRSAPLPTGGYLEQADGTAWMAMYCQYMFEMAIELTVVDSSYEDMAVKFADHFFWIAAAINRPGQDGLWDEEDGFYYDLLRLDDGHRQRLKIRSIVGLLPLCAVTVVEPEQIKHIPRVISHIADRIQSMPDLRINFGISKLGQTGYGGRQISSILTEDQLCKILTRMLDEKEFLSPYGIRALSRYHADNPYVYQAGKQEYRVEYLPAESDSGMFGGNSNWRGPIWFPINAILIRSLLVYYLYYGDSFKVECPTGSGKMMTFFEIAQELCRRLTSIFLADAQGHRPVYGDTDLFQKDPYWREHILFYEYFHGDNGAGIGASHQTGWTGIVAVLLNFFKTVDSKKFLEKGIEAAKMQK